MRSRAARHRRQDGDLVARPDGGAGLGRLAVQPHARRAEHRLERRAEPSDGLVESTVASDKNAIGFNSGYYASQRDVHAVSFNGVACNLANAKSGQYPGIRTYYEVTRGPATGAASAFIHWIQKSPVARKIIASIAIPLD